MFRGKSIGRDWLVMYASTHELKVYVDSGPDYWLPPELRASSLLEAGIVAEVQIPWTYGVGHADAFIVETGTIVEVLSSAHVSEEMRHSKILQCVLYMEHYEAAKAGALIVVSPTDLEEEVFPIAKTSASYGELVAEMRARIEQVQTWSEKGTLPDRVCRKPADARSHFCRYDEPCFADWVAPEPDAILTGMVAEHIATRYYRAKQEETLRRRDLATAESARKEVEQELDEQGVPLGKTAVGPFEVIRTHIDRKPTVDLRKAELAGYPVDSLEEFMKPGASYDTFRISRVSDAPLDDFGDEAPWTDADLIVAPVGATERTS